MNLSRKAGMNPRTPGASRPRTCLGAARSVWSASALAALFGSWPRSRSKRNRSLSMNLPRSADFSPQEATPAKGRPCGLKPAPRNVSWPQCALNRLACLLSMGLGTQAVFWLLLAGCATPGPVASLDLSEPGWRVLQGQALWTPQAGQPTLAGEWIAAANADGRRFVEFGKTPLTFVTARSGANGWRVEFPSRQLAFQGRADPPGRFGWLHAAEALSGDAPREPWTFTKDAGGGWRLENLRTGERIEAVLNP